MKCPICKIKESNSISENKTFPFCSPKCRDIDLYNWLSGEYDYFDEEDRAPVKFINIEEEKNEKTKI